MGRRLRGDGEIISLLVDIRFVTDQIALKPSSASFVLPQEELLQCSHLPE